MPLILAGATSGATTIQATNGATQTITLPNATGTVLTTNGSGIASVNGIQFPATQSASADANCLDDYEEGTWTPNLIATSGSITAQTTTGTYVRVGKLVIVQISISSITVGASTAIAINNLPFTINSTGSGSNGNGVAREDKTTGLLWFLGTAPATTTANFYRYDNASTVTSSLGWNGTLSYISA